MNSLDKALKSFEQALPYFWKRNRTSGQIEEQADDARIEDFFTENDRPNRLWKRIMLLTVVLAATTTAIYFVLFFRLPSTKPDPDYRFYGYSYDTVRRFTEACAFVASSLISLVASFLAVELVNRSNVSRIQYVKDLTAKGALRTIFYNLKSYRQKHTESKLVELTFESILPGNNGKQAIDCILSIHQRMHIIKKTFDLDFMVLDGSLSHEEKAKQEANVSLLGKEVPDDVYSIDIADLKQYFNDTTRQWGVSELIIDSVPYMDPPHRISPEKIDNRTRWSVDVSKHIGMGLIDVHYKYKFALELPGFTYFTVTDPTHGYVCILDFAKIRNHVNVYYIEMLNSKAFKHDARRTHVGDRIVVSEDDWIIPKSSVVFCWYEKPKQVLPATEQIHVETSTILHEDAIAPTT